MGVGVISDPNSDPNSDPRQGPKKGPKNGGVSTIPTFSDFSDAQPLKRAPQISFSDAPRIGTELDLDGQVFRLTATEPYTRKDGAPSFLLTWIAPCTDCGAEFAVKTGLVSKAVNRRCEAHRAPGKPATKAAALRVSALRKLIRAQRRGKAA